MGTIKLKLTNETKDILERYDVNNLLRTIPNDYSIPATSLKLYANRYEDEISSIPIVQDIELSQESQDRLKELAVTSNTQISSLHILFNFLVENICDCSKIHTKDISHALDNYYYVIKNSLKDEHCKALFKKLLDEYADSAYYDEKIGLSEESIAYFLAVSEKR